MSPIPWMEHIWVCELYSYKADDEEYEVVISREIQPEEAPVVKKWVERNELPVKAYELEMLYRWTNNPHNKIIIEFNYTPDYSGLATEFKLKWA